MADEIGNLEAQRRAKAFTVAPSAGHRPFSASRMAGGCAIAQITCPGFPTPIGRFIGKRSTQRTDKRSIAMSRGAARTERRTSTESEPWPQLVLQRSMRLQM
jgi:hypothetical protein